MSSFLKIELWLLYSTSRPECFLNFDLALLSRFSYYLLSFAFSYVDCFDCLELAWGERWEVFYWFVSKLSEADCYRLGPDVVLIGSSPDTWVENFLSFISPIGSESISVLTIILSFSNLCLKASCLSRFCFFRLCSCCLLCYCSMTVRGGWWSSFFLCFWLYWPSLLCRLSSPFKLSS